MTTILHRRLGLGGTFLFSLIVSLLVVAHVDDATADISTVGGDARQDADDCESPINIDNRIWDHTREHDSNACAVLESNSLTIPAGGVSVGVFLPRRNDCMPTPDDNGWHVADEADTNGRSQPGTIPAGWNVDVHLIHANRLSDTTYYPWKEYDGYVRFSQDIIGVIMGAPRLDQTDSTLGRRRPELDASDKWTYPGDSLPRGMEYNNATGGGGGTQAPDGNKDWVRTNCAGDQATDVSYPRLNFHLEVAEAVDQLRVITINYADFEVTKEFLPDNPVQPHPSSVSVSLTCGGATVDNIDTSASEGNDADFHVRNFTHDPRRTARPLRAHRQDTSQQDHRRVLRRILAGTTYLPGIATLRTGNGRPLSRCPKISYPITQRVFP